MAKRYSPKLKFQVVLELLRGDKTPVQVSRTYNVHPNSAGLCKRELLEKGPEIFYKDGVVAEYERRIAELEHMNDHWLGDRAHNLENLFGQLFIF